MPDAEELRKTTRTERERHAAATRAHAAATQRLRELRAELQAMDRTADGGRTEAARRASLQRQIEEDAQTVTKSRDALAASRTALATIGQRFEPLTDPRTAIAGLDASYPILLLPVRLETRFMSGELLVRIYPDDCHVDAFEPDLSEAEVRNLRRFWSATWSAGGDDTRERAAWRELCAAHGAGRSLYLIEQYQPLATADAVPVRSSPDEVILAIPADAPPASTVERAAIALYWTAVWRAGRDATARVSAQAALAGSVGAARADEVVATLAPYNIGDRPAAGTTAAAVPVTVTFVVMEPAATRATTRQSWTHAPEARLLPDRFLFMADSGPEHVEVLGSVVRQPLVVGPDPLAPEADRFSRDGNDDLVFPDSLAWMTDFDAALRAGMAMRVPLTPRQAREGFDRVSVIGLRLSADHEEARLELEELLTHQARSQSGFALLPQGTATNNSEQGSSGWARIQEADELFGVARATMTGSVQFASGATEPYERRDGLHLAEALGIDSDILQRIANADATDQLEARAMNAALWPATLGYWMDTQLQPVFSPDVIERTRQHFINRVSGRGAVPAIRIGKQPYGILPTTAFTRITWLDAVDGPERDGPRGGNADRKFLRALRDLLAALRRDVWAPLAATAPRVGGPTSNPLQQLVDIVGLHPSSVEFHLDIMDSADRIWSRHGLRGKSRLRLRAAMEREMAAGVSLLESLGHTGTRPEILEKFFSHVHGPQNRPAIDEAPLSEIEGLLACTDDGRNYIAWARDAARTAFEDLRLQRGFSGGVAPNALFYHMLRHALQLGYHSAAVQLHVDAGLIRVTDVAATFREPPFVHVASAREQGGSESRYELLYAPAERVAGTAGLSVADYIGTRLPGAGRSAVLADQVAALDVLEEVPTARLERAFAEHVDLCSYRLDSWMLSLVNERLDRMRRSHGRGIYVGAYGWLESLRPERATRQPVQLNDELRKAFAATESAPIMRESTNGGHVLAPSQNHAVTAAVLRSGYLNNATPATPDLLAIDLSSARVRVALQFIEGIRNGQPLGALLGYQLERRLHDRHAEAELDDFIYQIRKAFPLVAKRIGTTVDSAAADAAIESVEARNVCDGTLLLEHVRTSAVRTYPWGKALTPADATAQAIIDQEVAALFEIQDAIADLAVAESVHQTTMGNVERAAAAMDGYSKGGFPPEPDVITTPRTGTSLTHRVAVHLPVNAVAPAGASPRAAAEPAIDAWLASLVPPLNDIVIHVESTNAVPGSATVPTDVTITSLGLRPVDLLHLFDPANDQAMTELDDRIVQHVISTRGLTPDASIEIRYTEPVAGKVTMFELAPLLAAARTIVLEARALRPSDGSIPSEGSPARDEAVTIAATAIPAARAAVTGVRDDANTLLPALAALADPTTPLANVVAGIDAAAASSVTLQQRAALCGTALSGAGQLAEGRRAIFRLLRGKAAALARRWQDRLSTCDGLIAEAGDPTRSALQQLQSLERAEREVSTAYTTPIPATAAAYLPVVAAKRAAFAAALDAVTSVRDSAATTIAVLWTAWTATFAGRPALDLAMDGTTEDEEARIRLFARDMHRQLVGLVGELTSRVDAGDTLIADAASLSGQARVTTLQDAAKALLGDGFRLVPRFTLDTDHGVEWQNAFDARAALTTHLDAAHDFPVDDWLYGVSRVRTRVAGLESIIHLTGAFGTAEPSLEPVQFPHVPGDPWLALELPPGFAAETAGDRLLYTASYTASGFDRSSTSHGGILVDEWTEVLPATEERAGLAFHYDRPSHEPAQAMLLVTPASTGERWTWEDLHQAIPETFALAQLRAVEPREIARTPLARLLPATLMAFTTHDISISSGLRVADLVAAARRER